MADTYYQYKDVAELIVHRLQKLNGWKVYGWSPAESDPYTDYYCPSYWDGIATKNGYTFVFNNKYARKEKEEKKYVVVDITLSEKVRNKIKLLKNMTIENGCTPSEEKSAKEKIEILMNKEHVAEKEAEKTVEIIKIPGCLANPPRCNWHIEKDGIIVAKGSGLLKFSSCPDIYKYERELQAWQEYNTHTEEELVKMWAKDECWKYPATDEDVAIKRAKETYKHRKKQYELLEKFNQFISMIDSTCGNMMGNDSEFYTYEKVKKTEYKKENKAVECDGEIKDGQCFIVKSNFTYGTNSGYVYRIHEMPSAKTDSKHYIAYRLNGKLTKECHGYANKANSWYIDNKRFMWWINNGDLAFCRIEEVSTPYEVEKVVKVYKNKNNESHNNSNVTFTIKEDVDTRDNSKLWVVKINEKVDKEEYLNINRYMKSIGGYYSKFKD